MTESGQPPTSFWSELKRRRVYRVAAAYAAGAFVLLEAFDLLAEALGLPPVVLTVLVVTALFGFPLALILAWAFEVRPEGVRRTAAVDGASSGAGGGRGRLAILVLAGVLIAGGAGWWILRPDAGAGVNVSDIRSVAVLPLANTSGEPGEQPFVSGMHEELINQLSRVGALLVKSRTSVLRYGTDSVRNIPDIGRELDVDAVLEGSVLRVDDDVRINVSLIHVGTDTNLWSESFDREMRDVLALHSDVARAVAAQVEAVLTPAEEQVLTRTRQVDPRAVEEYVRGRYLWNERGPEIAQALEAFQTALEIDSTFAEAWAGIADTYVVPSGTGLADDPSARAEEAARRALAIDPSLAGAHTSLAYALAQQFDWEASEGHFLRALELNPSYGTAYQWYAEVLAAQNRMDEAVAAARRATELDPLSEIIAWSLARILYFARRYDDALRQLDAKPPRPSDLWLRMKVLQQVGRTGEAFAFMIDDPRTPPRLRDSLRVFRDEGLTPGAVLQRMARGGPGANAPPDLLAPPLLRAIARLEALAEAGRVDEAFSLLDELFELGLGGLIVDVAVDPAFDPLRQDPRYRAVLERANLAEFWPAAGASAGS